MIEPEYGYLYGDKESSGCWYYFLTKEKEGLAASGGIDLGYHMIQEGIRLYVALDWLEQVQNV